MIKISACIFDMDGTLVDSMMDIAFSMNSALCKLGCRKIKLKKFNNLLGTGLNQLVIDILKENNLNYNKDLKEQIYSEFINEYKKNIKQNTKEYNGISNLLKEINSMKIPIGILSNKNQEQLDEIVKNLFNDINFFKIRGYSGEFPPKPDSKGALDMINKIKIIPEEIAYIGDSDVDMHLAINAGFIPIGVSWGFRSIKELKDNGAKFILKTPFELIDIIKTGNNL